MVDIKIVSTASIPGVETISDRQKIYKISPEKKYILDFTDGSTTMRAFKELFLLNKDILFHVVNFEFFIYKMRLFKHSNFELLNYPEDKIYQRIETYKSIEISLSGKYSQKGVDLSFSPDIFASIRSSLLRPDLYLSEENISTMIYKVLGRAIKYDELKDLVWTKWDKKDEVDRKSIEEFDKHFDESLKSLVFAGVVRTKDQLFFKWAF